MAILNLFHKNSPEPEVPGGNKEPVEAPGGNKEPVVAPGGMKGGLEPPICGGTRHSEDENAPTKIQSRDLIFFKAGTDGGSMGMHSKVYAAKAERGIYIVDAEDQPRFALLRSDCDFLSRLDELVREQDLILGNGQHSRTAGLPADFGGSIDVRYASGEFISKSDNQSPIITRKADDAISEFFARAFDAYPRADLPDPSLIRKVTWREDGEDHHRVITFEREGVIATLHSESKYATSDMVYRSDAQVPAQAFDRIVDDVNKFCLFGLEGVRQYHTYSSHVMEETLTYELSDGSQFVLPNFYGVIGGVSNVVFETRLYLEDLLKA